MEPGKIYHVYNRGNNRQNIFFDDENYRFFKRQFEKHLSDKLDLITYCLMPNHFHLLVRVRATEGVPDHQVPEMVIRSFKNFFISYAKAINKKYNRTGSLFQPKFKRKEVDNDFYLSWLIQYIHYNPVKARLCENYPDWNYSSYKDILTNNPAFMCAKEVIEWFGGIKEFIRIHAERVIGENQLNKYLFDS